MFHEIADPPHEAALPESDVISFGGLTLHRSERSISCHGRQQLLSPKELALLETLMQGRGRMYTRAALFELLYGDCSDRSEKVIEVLMSTLRSKLGKLGADELIETRRGYGYIIPLI
jgi:two-component system copper resistance phosphate regulon response regulator CusR